MTNYFGNLCVNHRLHIYIFSSHRVHIFPYKLFDHLHLDECQRNWLFQFTNFKTDPPTKRYSRFELWDEQNMDTYTPNCFLILCFSNCNSCSSIRSYVFYVRFNSCPHRSTSVLTFIIVKSNVINFHKLDSDFTAIRYWLDGPGI